MLASRVSPFRAVLLAGLLASAWAAALHTRAALSPPPGRAFAGTFHWIDDVYNYASYAQQAESGRFLMRNKLLPPERARAVLVNLEWWTVGRLSAALGRRPLLAYRVFAALAALALAGAAERWLSRAGVPASHRFPALLLALFGGGLGGALFEATDLEVHRCLDLFVGAFPYLEVLANPHFAAGTALLAGALWCFAAVPAPRGPVLGVLLGTVLGLVRPYDLALLGLVRGVAVLATRPPSRWAREIAPLLGLLPVLLYDVWLFFGTDQFASFRQGGVMPRWIDYLPAFGPALALAVASLASPASDAAARAARAHLWAWAGCAFGLVAARPSAFALQWIVGAGLPLLVLGAAALARRPAAVTALAAAAFAGTAAVQTRIVLGADPNWFVPRERLAAAEALRSRCREGDRVIAPPDIGLYAIGLTACTAVVSHPAEPDHARRLADVAAFYSAPGTLGRVDLLDRERVTHLVLPGYAGPHAEAWLGEGAPFDALKAPADVWPLALYERRRDPTAR
jgi:hypothetical protein